MGARGQKIGGHNLTRGRVMEILKLVRRKFVQGAEAEDATGGACHFDDSSASAWDIAGATAKVMGVEAGWSVANRLYGIIAVPLVLPPIQHGFQKLVDWWDQMNTVVYQSALRRLEDFSLGRNGVYENGAPVLADEIG